MSPPDNPPDLLVIVPYGRAKVWDRHSDAGSTAAAANTGAPFTVNRRYAEQTGGDWGILSAKYGFLRATDLIPGPYEVTGPTHRGRGAPGAGDSARPGRLFRGGRARRQGVPGGDRSRRRREPCGPHGSVLPIGKAMGATKQATHSHRLSHPLATSGSPAPGTVLAGSVPSINGPRARSWLTVVTHNSDRGSLLSLIGAQARFSVISLISSHAFTRSQWGGAIKQPTIWNYDTHTTSDPSPPRRPPCAVPHPTVQQPESVIVAPPTVQQGVPKIRPPSDLNRGSNNSG